MKITLGQHIGLRECWSEHWVFRNIDPIYEVIDHIIIRTHGKDGSSGEIVIYIEMACVAREDFSNVGAGQQLKFSRFYGEPDWFRKPGWSGFSCGDSEVSRTFGQVVQHTGAEGHIKLKQDADADNESYTYIQLNAQISHAPYLELRALNWGSRENWAEF